MRKDTYYTLLVWNADAREWSPEFGDYSEDVVREQGESMTEELSYFDSTWRVIVTDDDQDSIYTEVERLNDLVEVYE
jgi:hypothetical protein